MPINYPKNISFSCSKCGLCCGDTINKTRHILLLESDANRIAKYTSQQINNFANQNPENTPYIYEMKKNTQDGKCIFLKNNQCTIYKQRPLICRFYPFELTSTEEDFIFKSTQECPGIANPQPQTGKKTLNELHFKKLVKMAAKHMKTRSQ